MAIPSRAEGTTAADNIHVAAATDIKKIFSYNNYTQHGIYTPLSGPTCSVEENIEAAAHSPVKTTSMHHKLYFPVHTVMLILP